MGRLSLFLVFLFSFAELASAQSRVDCNALHSHILGDVHYCVLLPSGYDSPGEKTKRYPVLYFLHGLGDNEQALLKSGGWNLIEDMRQQKKIGDFLVVTPEAKATFYVNSADGKVRYSDFFLEEFMPYIENRYRVRRERSTRAITGISMGGYGALRFAFAFPRLFSAVSAQSAALMTESPQELDAAMRSDMSLRGLLENVFGNPINVGHWRENDPFALALKNKAALATLAIYFNCGRDDDYEFESGAQKLDRQLTEENIPHEFHLYPGDHSAAYFFSHLGEVMEFHWRNFAAAK
jgi:S-formylglutathione hydrolase FrmB